MNILCIAGKAGSGKDTVASRLASKHGWECVAFADPMKRFCREVYDFTEDQLWGPSSMRNAPDHRYPRPHTRTSNACPCCGVAEADWSKVQCYLTPRYALQTLGTEWGRDCFPNTWIDLGLGTAKRLLGGGYVYTRLSGMLCSPGHEPPPGVVFTDGRFPNEWERVVGGAGKVVLVDRPGAGLGGAAGAHESERHLVEDAFPWTTVLRNHGTLEDLDRLVDGFVEYVTAIQDHHP